jgi:hypothetical protein
MRSPVAEALARLDEVLRELGVRYYLFGAQAALLYGSARLSVDIDVTVELGGVTTASLARALKTHGFPPSVADPAFLDATRVLPVVHQPTGTPVDIVLGGPGLEELFLSRAGPKEVEGVSVTVAAVDDLMAMKILAGRPKDIDDVRAMLAAQPSRAALARLKETLTLLEQALDRSDLVSELDRLQGPPRRGGRPAP